MFYKGDSVMSNENNNEKSVETNYEHHVDLMGSWLQRKWEEARQSKYEPYEPYVREDGTVIGAET